MNKEDKDLLFKDLCTRLPYGVKLQKFNEPDSAFELYSFNKESGEIMFYKYRGKALEIADAGRLYRHNVLLYKPFLRPMSSMTEEEKKELKELHFYYTDGHIVNDEDKDFKPIIVDEVHCFCIIDWLNAHYFDYRGLIEKGLALRAPKGMYKMN